MLSSSKWDMYTKVIKWLISARSADLARVLIKHVANKERRGNCARGHVLSSVCCRGRSSAPTAERALRRHFQTSGSRHQTQLACGGGICKRVKTVAASRMVSSSGFELEPSEKLAALHRLLMLCALGDRKERLFKESTPSDSLFAEIIVQSSRHERQRARCSGFQVLGSSKVAMLSNF